MRRNLEMRDVYVVCFEAFCRYFKRQTRLFYVQGHAATWVVVENNLEIINKLSYWHFKLKNIFKE
jgi:hypothetical protein